MRLLQLSILCVVFLTPPVYPTAATSGDLTTEAQQEAQKFIDARILRLPDNGDQFSCTIYDRGTHTDFNYLQYKGLTFQVFSDKLSEIEVLNGLTWRGTIAIRASAIRTLYYKSDSAPKDRMWTEWADFGQLTCVLKKKRGTWRITPLFAGGMGNTAPTLDQVKEVLQYPMKDET